VVVVCGGAAVALTAFGPEYLPWSTAKADQRFVAAVQAEGRTVEPGETQELVIEAAHKLCLRKVSVTTLQRRESTLTPDEIAAVHRTFGADQQAFMKAALQTYCA
jgi:hypothetical protein